MGGGGKFAFAPQRKISFCMCMCTGLVESGKGQQILHMQEEGRREEKGNRCTSRNGLGSLFFQSRTDSKTFSYTGQIPARFYGKLGHGELPSLVHNDLAVHVQATGPDRLLELGQMHVGLCDCNGRADLDALVVYVFLVEPGREMAVGVHRDDLFGVRPLGERADGGGGLGVGEVGFVVGLEFIDGEGEGVVDAVRTAMGADCCNSVRVNSELPRAYVPTPPTAQLSADVPCCAVPAAVHK